MHSGCQVCEFPADGRISGVFYFDAIAPDAYGTWRGTSGDHEWPFELKRKDTMLKVDTSFTPGDIAGGYGYQYGMQGPEGGISGDRLDHSRVAFDIGCVTGAPGRHLAKVDRDCCGRSFGANATVEGVFYKGESQKWR